jgi:membrane protein YdbS with pleckstrin-like domain
MKHYQSNQFLKQYPLSSKKIIKKMVEKIWAIFLIALGMMSWVLVEYHKKNAHNAYQAGMHYAFLGLLFLLPVLLVCYYFYERWYIATYFYNVSDNLLIIRKGPIAPQEITIPFNRIQDIYLDQDIFDRLIGLYDVHISTATATSGIRAHIDGVDKDVAEKLRELLLEKIENSQSKK